MSEMTPVTVNKRLLWAGRGVSALPVLALTMSATMKLKGGPQVMEGFTGHFGYPASAVLPIGIAELLCVILYVIPQTSVLGAAIATGYLGGVVATHVRMGEGFGTAIVLGVLLWIGLWLREPRLMPLFPLRKPL